MEQRQKTILAFLLMIIVILPLFYYSYLQLKQFTIWHQMEEKLEKCHLHAISIPTKEVVWHKKNKEIVIDGRLFDVKSFMIQRDEITFYGLYDNEETEIKSQIKELQERDQKSHATGKSNIAKFLLNIFVNDVQPILPLDLTFPCKFNRLRYCDSLTSVDLSLPSPPPKVI